jgi:acetyl esterase/lipase
VDHSEVLDRRAERPDLVVRYAEHSDGLVDVFVPASLGRPATPGRLLVLVHGGFWRQAYDRVHVRPLANALTRHGWVVAVPEYRRTSGAGGWPMTGDDVRTALGAIPGLIEDTAPGRIDPEDAATVVGHSAGGHLALWAGLLAEPGRVRGIVALAPVADLHYAAQVSLDAGATQLLLGGEPDEVPDAYDAADPFLGLAVHSGSDIGHPAITVIHGTADRQVPVAMSRSLATRHPRIHYVELEGVDHFALIDPLSDAFTSALLPALPIGSH